MSENIVLIKRFIHWLLFAVTVVYLISGLGITQYHAIESITFGLLSKSLSFTVHDNLLIPFLVLLILHIVVTIIDNKTRKD
jgi:dolichol kinase